MAHQPALALERVIVHDGRTHDVVWSWTQGRHLVFDTTCAGLLKSVSIWNHKPSARETRQARLEQGWKPMPSETDEGEDGKWPGHSCKVVSIET